MAKTITVRKYYKPSLGKEVNKAGYTRKVKDAPEREKYERPELYVLDGFEKGMLAYLYEKKPESKNLIYNQMTVVKYSDNEYTAEQLKRKGLVKIIGASSVSSVVFPTKKGYELGEFFSKITKKWN